MAEENEGGGTPPGQDPKLDYENLKKSVEEILQLLNVEVSKRQEINRLLNLENTEITRNIENSIKNYQKSSEELNVLKQIVNKLEERNRVNDAGVRVELKRLDLEETVIKSRIREIRLNSELSEDERKQQIERELASLKNITNEKKIYEVRKKSLDLGRKIANNFGLFNKENTTFGSMFENFSTYVSGIGGISDGLLDSITPANLLGSSIDSLIKKTKELAISQDEMLVSIGRASGDMNRYSEQVYQASFAASDLGVDTQSFGNSTLALKQSFRGFDELGDNFTFVTSTVAGLEKMGLSASSTAKNMQFLKMNFNATADEAVKFNYGLVKLAKQTSFTPQQISDAFQQAQSVISAVGDKTGSVFTKLTSIMESTGLEMSKILQLTSKFDTFEGAADSVGKLNALLGGPYLSTIEMVNETDPSKRFMLTADAIREAYGAYDQLEYYQKKALASALGLQDVTDLASVMAGRDDLIMDDPFKNMSQAEIVAMKKEMQEFNTVMQLLATLGRQFAIGLKPVIESLKNVMTALINSGFIDFLGKVLAPVIVITSGLIALTFVVKSLSFAFTAVTSGISLLYNGLRSGLAMLQVYRNSGIMGVIGSIKTWIMSLVAKDTAQVASDAKETASQVLKKKSIVLNRTQAASNTTLASSMLGVGVAALGIGAGIALVGLGIKLAIDSITNFSSVLANMPITSQAIAFGSLALALGAFTLVAYFASTAISSLGTATLASAGPMLAFAAGALGVGLAVTLVGYGIKLVVDSIANLATATANLPIANLAFAFGSLTLSLGAFVVVGYFASGAISALGTASLASAGPMLAFASGAIGVGIAMTLVGLGVKLVVDSISNLVVAFASLFSTAGIESLLLIFNPLTVGSMYAASGGIIMFSASLIALSLSLLALSPSIGIFTKLSDGFSNIETGSKATLDAVDKLNQAISGMAGNVDNLSRIADEFERIKNSINDMSFLKTSMLTVLSTLSVSGLQNQPSTLQPVSGQTENSIPGMANVTIETPQTVTISEPTTITPVNQTEIVPSATTASQTLTRESVFTTQVNQSTSQAFVASDVNTPTGQTTVAGQGSKTGSITTTEQTTSGINLNINLKAIFNGKEFATAVNQVAIDRKLGSALSDSVVDLAMPLNTLR